MMRPSTRLPAQRLKCGLQRLPRPRHDGLHLHASAARGLPDLRRVGFGEGIELVDDHADTAPEGTSSRISSTLLPATSAPPLDNPVTLPPGRARLATSRSRPGRPRLPSRSESRSSPASRPSGRRKEGDDEVNLETDQFGGLFQLKIRSRFSRSESRGEDRGPPHSRPRAGPRASAFSSGSGFGLVKARTPIV